jgi:hypothetical protein
VICFDIVIPKARGAIYAMYFKQGGEVANMVTEKMAEAEAIVPAQKQVKMTIMQAHNQFRHAHKDAVHKAVKATGITISPEATYYSRPHVCHCQFAGQIHPQS